jgi:hypothetical protein
MLAEQLGKRGFSGADVAGYGNMFRLFCFWHSWMRF